MRVATALLVGLGLTPSRPFALAQTATPEPATAAARAQNAAVGSPTGAWLLGSRG